MGAVLDETIFRRNDGTVGKGFRRNDAGVDETAEIDETTLRRNDP